MAVYTYPQWQPALHAAITEFDQQELKKKVSAAEYVILKRLFEIAGIGDRNEERQALQDATNTLLALKRKAEQPLN